MKSFELIRNLVLLAARLGLGIVLIAHGWQKIDGGIDGTAAGFEAMGVPLPGAAAWFATLVEFGGGIALILGLAVPIVGVLVAANMAGAWAVAHTGVGIFVSDGGFEFVLVIMVAALLLAVSGAGAFSIDRFLAPVVFKNNRPEVPAAA
ncbi:DoxX family protein [Actinoalloteichus hymeniacidonis]|uniref:Membrane protein n=1 Tax=Actinoalloteichus hymeniacidonis TaxID=340345 RepID=A0AAC9HPP4_9PSEU|nr:DoxX family protein [Actinoalloteichus hymeniacidonis]AOS63071.1 putative membrane protein [Actinoalloteichus hymeniacidonis]MBB5908893.1 putative oxidoreductase [Actinoalloteichus hymeniacidonis]